MPPGEDSIFAAGPPRSLPECPVPDLLPELARVTEEIQFLCWDQQVWRSFDAIAEGSPVARESHFRGWVGELYFRRADLAIRAMRDRDSRSHSLGNLLTAVTNRAGEIPCPVIEMRADGAVTIDPDKVQADLDALDAAAAAARDYVNKVLAHFDRGWNGDIPEPEVIDAAIGLIGKLVVKYTLILRGIDVDIRTRAAFNWTAEFREAWLPG
jgi:hypothetical protein